MTHTELREYLEELLLDNNDINTIQQFSEADWKEILKYQPLQHAIEKEFSGTDISTVKCLENLELASYFSVALTLMFGINIALFLEPVAKYGSDTLKQRVLHDFLSERRSGGLMITEPDYGTDALNMETTFEIQGDKVKIQGMKHWQGLTGQADYWLVAGKVVEDGVLSKQISFCVVPQSDVEFELFETQGLKPIQYGTNRIDTEVPLDNLLIHKKGDNSMILDLLHRSRMQFAGMASGLVKRSLDTAVKATSDRVMRGKPLISLPEIKKSIIDMQTYYTITKACYYYSSKHSGIENDLEEDAIMANMIKVTVTEMMQKSTYQGIQLSGGNGFLDSNFAFHGWINSRPFLIFEGPNDMLSYQLVRLTLLGMKKGKMNSAIEYYSSISKDNTVLGEEYAPFDFTLHDLLLRDTNKKEAMGKCLMALLNVMLLEELRSSDFNSAFIDNAIAYTKNVLVANRALLEQSHEFSALEIG